MDLIFVSFTALFVVPAALVVTALRFLAKNAVNLVTFILAVFTLLHWAGSTIQLHEVTSYSMLYCVALGFTEHIMVVPFVRLTREILYGMGF